MLKACCDCITAGIREQNDAYGADTVQLNGRSPRAPSWPQASSNKENMFLLPRILELGDQINVTGLISNDSQWATISLITERDGPNGKEPDYNNIASQLNLNFTSNEGDGSVVLKSIRNGAVEAITAGFTPAELIPDFSTSTFSEITFRLQIAISNNGFYEVEFYIGESYVDKIAIRHRYNDIRYLALDGDIEKVKRIDFIFA